MRLSTDDAARRLEWMWLKPGFDARGSAWMQFVIASTLLSVVAFFGSPFVDWLPWPAAVTFLVHVLFAVIVACVVSLILVRRVGRHISPETSLRHHAVTAFEDLSSPREEEAARPLTFSFDPAQIWAEKKTGDGVSRTLITPAFLTDATTTGGRKS